MNTKLKKKSIAFIVLIVVLGLFVSMSAASAESGKISVAKPTILGEYVYDGKIKSPDIPVSEYYVFDTLSKVNAGTYYITVSLKDKTRYTWEDGTTTDIVLPFVIEKGVFDESALVYEDMVCLYDGVEHFITIGNLPQSANVLFNTVKTMPGVYESEAFVDLGDNYVNRELHLTGACLTILATEIVDKTDSSISLIVGSGLTHEAELVLGKGKDPVGFYRRFASGESAFVICSPSVMLNGETVSLSPDGTYGYKIYMPNRDRGIKVYVYENGEIKTRDFNINGSYIGFNTSEVCPFAVVYTSPAREGAPELLWLELLFGVLLFAEVAYLVWRFMSYKKSKE